MSAADERAHWDTEAEIDPLEAAWPDHGADGQMGRAESVATYVPWIWDRIFPGLSYSERSELTVVDLGCGYGRLTFPIAEKLHSVAPNRAHVIGVDVSPKMIGHCLRTAYAVPVGRRLPASFVVGDGRRIPIGGVEHVTAIYSQVTFQHVDTETVVGYIDEAARLLARPGTLCFQFIEPHGGEDVFLSHAHDTERLVNAIGDAGFDSATIDPDPHFENWLWLTAEKS